MILNWILYNNKKKEVSKLNNLKMLRQEKKWTQNELADRLGVQASAVSKYENGKLQLSEQLLIQISSIFNVSVDYLIGNTNNREKSNKQSVNNENILDLNFDMLTDEEIDDTFTSYLKKQDRVMFFDPESDRSPEEKRAILKELTKKEKKRQEKIDKLNKLPDDLLDEALCYAEFRAQKKSKK